MKQRRIIDISALISRYRGALMGICALAILFFHDWVTTVSEFPVIGTIEGVLKKYGYYGVDVFFLLSGMGLAYSMKKGTSIRSFYVRRFRRVCVPYIEVIILKTLLEKWSVGVLVSRVLCIELFSRGIYSFLWFAQMIPWVYLLYPLLHRLLERSRNDSLLLAAIIVGVLLVEVLSENRIESAYRGLLFRILTFLIGVWIGRRQEKHIVCSEYQYVVGLLVLSCIYAACAYWRRMKGIFVLEIFQLSSFALVFSCTVAGICAWIDSLKNPIMKALKGCIRLLEFCGTFTLELYAIQEFYWYIAGPLEGRLTYLQTNLLCMVLLPIFAYLLNRFNLFAWRIIEIKA